MIPTFKEFQELNEQASQVDAADFRQPNSIVLDSVDEPWKLNMQLPYILAGETYKLEAPEWDTLDKQQKQKVKDLIKKENDEINAYLLKAAHEVEARVQKLLSDIQKAAS